MNKHYLKTTQSLSVFFLAVVISYSFVSASLANRNKFEAFCWTQATNNSDKNGCYAHLKVDSITTNPSKYYSGLYLGWYSWWRALFPNNYRVKTAITTSKGRPTAITKASGSFSSVEWFTGFERTGSKDAIRFYFPMLPQNTKYGRFDYYTVSVNDTLAVEFYGANDSIMVGTFVHKKPTSEGCPIILARDALIIELTNQNTFRIKSVRFNSAYINLLKLYLTFDLTSLKKNVSWYGIDLQLLSLAKEARYSDTYDETTPLMPITPSFTPMNDAKGIRINYTLPLGIKRLSVSLYDLKGRCIKQVITNTGLLKKNGAIQIVGPLNAGHYLVQLHAVFNNGQKPLFLQKQWTSIR